MQFTEQEIEDFKTEATELLDVAEKSLLAMDQVNSEAEFKPLYDAAFRSFHNLKGASGMMELLELQSHTHELETIFTKFKTETLMPKHYISFFLKGIDAARTLLEGGSIQFDYQVEAVQTQEVPTEALQEFYAEVDEMMDRLSKNLQSFEQKFLEQTSSPQKAHSHGVYGELLDAIYRDAHSFKGAAYLFSFNTMGEIAHAMESGLENIREGTHSPSKELIDLLFKSLKLLDVLLSKAKTKTDSSEISVLAQAVVRALHAATQKLQVVTEPTKPIAAYESPKEAPKETKEPKEKIHIPEAHAKDEATTSVRVSIALLDSLMALMGEMVLVRNQVLQHVQRSEDVDFINMGKRLNVVTGELQSEMMKTRMQPVGNVLNKFNRVVRDLSQSLNKNIHFEVHGAETELDKSLLEAIKDPLTHIVRNSCDHGIETPEKRVESGKPAQGTVVVQAYHESGQVIIEVTDDGKGLDAQVLKQKAIEKGILQATQAAQLTEKEAFQLIFEPGFSTAEKVTNVSGRGVGMDVVRTNLERIGGSIDLSSQKGKGSTIKLKIPLTLAIVPVLLVKCHQELFAIPQMRLEELVRVEPESNHQKIEYIHGSPVLRLRGNILPLVHLRKILGHEDSDLGNSVAESTAQQALTIAVLQGDQGSFGLIIDEVQDTVDIVVKPLSPLIKSLQAYSGATILGDGSVALILDVAGIAKLAQISSGMKEVAHQLHEKNQDKYKSENQEYLFFNLSSPTRHALVLGYVHRLEEFKKSDIEYSAKKPVLRYRGTLLPLISVNEQLGYDASKDFESDIVPVMVVKKGDLYYGLVIQQVADIVATHAVLDTEVVKHAKVFGHLILDQELVVVVDPYEMIDSAYPENVTDIHRATPHESAAVHSIAHAATVSFHGKKVLLVEDTVFFRKAISIVLEKKGFIITHAADGQEAMEYLNAHENEIDLVISDIEMPKMNGFQLAEFIRKHSKHSKLPMIAVSSRSDRKYIEQGLQSGFNIYLEKFKPAALLNSIEQVLSQGKGAA